MFHLFHFLNPRGANRLDEWTFRSSTPTAPQKKKGITYSWWFRNPAAADMVNIPYAISHYLQGFINPRWLWMGFLVAINSTFSQSWLVKIGWKTSGFTISSAEAFHGRKGVHRRHRHPHGVVRKGRGCPKGLPTLGDGDVVETRWERFRVSCLSASEISNCF